MLRIHSTGRFGVGAEDRELNVQQTHIVVATFRGGLDMGEVAATIPAEVAKVEELRAAGRMGAVHIALARGTVFIEVLAADEAAAVDTVNELPMGRFFELDVFETMPPGIPEDLPA